VDRMRKNGWIDIADKDDGLSQQITVTAIGRKLLAAAHVEWKKAQKQTAELLGEEGVAAVRKLHDTIKPGKAKA
jgi:DNA-binding MarR family transcriptional regulator